MHRYFFQEITIKLKRKFFILTNRILIDLFLIINSVHFLTIIFQILIFHAIK